MKLCPTCFKDICNHKSEKFECDELMVYPIQKLNKLGYKTEFCCSGHVTRSEIYSDDGSTIIGHQPDGEHRTHQMYIMFKETYVFSDYPYCWELKLNPSLKKPRWCLEYAPPCNEGDFRRMGIKTMKYMMSLYAWVDNLKPFGGKIWGSN